MEEFTSIHRNISRARSVYSLEPSVTDKLSLTRGESTSCSSIAERNFFLAKAIIEGKRDRVHVTRRAFHLNA